MSKTPNYDAKIKAILDATKPGERVCELTGEKWFMDEEEIGWYRKFNVPPSNLAPLARMKILAGFMVGYQMWWQKHPKTGKPVLTFVHPATGIKVLPDQEWLVEDFSSINSVFDSKRPFLEQLRDLQLRVPVRAARNLMEPENSIAINSFGDINSYFTIHNSQGRNCFFCSWTHKVENSSEIHNVLVTQNSHQVDDASNIFNSRYVRDAKNIMNSAFVAFSGDLENCFGAVSKYHKKYILWNKQVSRGEYEAEVAKLDLGKRTVVEACKKRFHDLLASSVWPEKMSLNDQNCLGEYCFDAVNCRYCYQSVGQSRDMYHCAFTASDSFDNAFCVNVSNASNCYQCSDVHESMDCKFCAFVSESRSLEYCLECENCENCFGCVGLRRKRFHVFNRACSESEYFSLVDSIKTALIDTSEYGSFFPLAMSPLYFLQSAAALYFSATEADAKTLEALSFDPEAEGAIGEELYDDSRLRLASEIPDNVSDLDPEAWAGVPILDETVNRRFAFLRPEIEHYRSLRIAPPNRHPVFRMHDLIRQANLGIFEDAACGKCGKSIVVAKNTAFPKRTIYCIDCYWRHLEAAT